jgi:hypothetical protein
MIIDKLKYCFFWILLITVAIVTSPVQGEESFLIEFKDDLLTVKVEDTSLKKVLAEMERKCDIKILSDDLSDEKVTIRFNGLPIDEGILRIIEYHNSILLYEEREIGLDQSSPPRLKEVIILSKDGKGINRGVIRETNLANVSAIKGEEESQLFHVLMRDLLESNDAGVREDAVEELSEMDDPRAVDLIFHALGDEDGDVRASAAQALGDKRSKSAVEPLINILRDRDSWVRESAVDALGEIGDPRAIEHLKLILADEDEDVRASADEALKRLGGKE